MINAFDKLVEDLKKENLLDEFALVSATVKRHFDNIQPASNGVDSVSVVDNFQSFFDEPKMAIPTPELAKTVPNVTAAEENEVKSVFEQPTPHYPVSTLHKTHNLLKYKTRRGPKKVSKGLKFCRTCSVNIPFYSLNCRYCHNKAVGDLSYYVLMIFSAVIFTMFILFLLSEKTYK